MLIAQILEENRDIQVVLAGGVIRNGYHCTLGYQAIRFLQQFSVDKAFLGVSSISMNGGFTTPNIEVSEIKEVMMVQAKQTIVLSDSSKFGKRMFHKFADLDGVDMLITDNGISSEWRDMFGKMETELVLAKEI